MAVLSEALIAFCLAVFIGTFVEYWVHRLMHAGVVYGKNHAKHHQEGTGQGWFGEFRGYFLPALVIIWLGFVVSPAAGIGFQPRDIVREVNGVEISSAETLNKVASDDTRWWRFTVERDGRMIRQMLRY